MCRLDHAHRRRPNTESGPLSASASSPRMPRRGRFPTKTRSSGPTRTFPQSCQHRCSLRPVAAGARSRGIPAMRHHEVDLQPGPGAADPFATRCRVGRPRTAPSRPRPAHPDPRRRGRTAVPPRPRPDAPGLPLHRVGGHRGAMIRGFALSPNGRAIAMANHLGSVTWRSTATHWDIGRSIRARQARGVLARRPPHRDRRDRVRRRPVRHRGGVPGANAGHSGPGSERPAFLARRPNPGGGQPQFPRDHPVGPRSRPRADEIAWTPVPRDPDRILPRTERRWPRRPARRKNGRS